MINKLFYKYIYNKLNYDDYLIKEYNIYILIFRIYMI